MIVTKTELREIVEACWAVATEAELPGTFEMNCSPPGNHDMVRFQTYLALLSCVVPKHMIGTQTFKTDDPKEPWQG